MAINKLRERRQELALEEDVLPALDGPEQAAASGGALNVDRALDEMGEPEREIFLRHYYYGQTVAAIGLEMQMNVSTVKVEIMPRAEKDESDPAEDLFHEDE